MRTPKLVRAVGHTLYTVAVPRPLREATGLALAAALSPLARLVVLVALVVVVAGTVLTLRGHGALVAGVAREGVLLTGALLILALMGAFAPQGRIVLRYIQREGLRRHGTWHGRAFRALARGIEATRAELEKQKRKEKQSGS